jgi:hypothetical protein
MTALPLAAREAHQRGYFQTVLIDLHYARVMASSL